MNHQIEYWTGSEDMDRLQSQRETMSDVKRSTELGVVIQWVEAVWADVVDQDIVSNSSAV